MELTVTINEKPYSVDFQNEIHLAIPLNFNGSQPNTYGVDKASAAPYRAGEFVGSVAQGGSCNFEWYKLVPHCNGTHTECIGHISENRINVHTSLKDSLIPATMVSVEPAPCEKCNEAYTPDINNEDVLITEKLLIEQLEDVEGEFTQAIIIRTFPNGESKMSRQYKNPPYFTHQAMRYLVKKGVKHLLVDMPSVDRMLDDGLLSNHHIFWNIDQDQKKINESDIKGMTITEMIYADNDVPDGHYLLNLQIAAFMGDASPSRPILYPISEKK